MVENKNMKIYIELYYQLKKKGILTNTSNMNEP